MPSGAAAMRQAMQAASSLLGRFTGIEQIHTQTVDLATPQQITVPKDIPLNRPLCELLIELKLRIAVTVANYADVAPEAIANLLQEILLQGTHAAHGALVPFRMSGATTFVLPLFAGLRGNDLLINGTRQADPGRPFADTFLGTTAASPYDVAIYWRVPLTPLMGNGPELKRHLLNFVYLPQDWSDLQLQLRFGDKSALGDPTGATVAFTGFGSGTGLPQLTVHGVYTLLGQFTNTHRNTGVVVRNEIVKTDFTSLATQTRLALLQKRITPNVIVKSGVLEATGQTAGVTTYESLSDVMLDETMLFVDNKPVRNNKSNLAQKAYYGSMFDTIIPQGYQLLSFVDGQNPLLAYRGDGLQGGAEFELRSDIESAAAGNRIAIVQEQIIGGPFPPVR